MVTHRHKGSFREPPDQLAKRIAHSHEPPKPRTGQANPAKRKPKRNCPAYQLNQGLFERASS